MREIQCYCHWKEYCDNLDIQTIYGIMTVIGIYLCTLVVTFKQYQIKCIASVAFTETVDSAKLIHTA